MIREPLATLYSKEIVEGIRIQYAGESEGRQHADFMAHPAIDGALVGAPAWIRRSSLIVKQLRGSWNEPSDEPSGDW